MTPETIDRLYELAEDNVRRAGRASGVRAEFARLLANEVREECAKEAESIIWGDQYGNDAASVIAKAIRATKDKP